MDNDLQVERCYVLAVMRVLNLFGMVAKKLQLVVCIQWFIFCSLVGSNADTNINIIADILFSVSNFVARLLLLVAAISPCSLSK